MIEDPTTLEEALEGVERDAIAALRSLAAAVKEAKRAKTAASLGQVRELQQALDASTKLAEQAAAAVLDMRSGWRFDVADWFSSGEYAKELLASAAEAGVQAFESDQRILCYPVMVEVSGADATIVIDKKKDRRVRPSVVVRRLGELQERPPKFKPEPFIASLADAYDYVVRSTKGGRPGVPVKLVEVHKVLTLLPGASREYTRQEFARDVYLLDQTGVVDTKDGRRMSLPASALTRGSGVLTTVSRTGQTKVYAGIAFSERAA